MINSLEIRPLWLIWGRVNLSTWSWEIKSSENECCCNFAFEVLKHEVLDVFFQKLFVHKLSKLCSDPYM